MKRCLFVLCLLAPLTAGAVSGSWVAEGGVTLEQGGMRDESAGLRPPNALPDANARITRVSWRYRLLGPEPVGLQAQLCIGKPLHSARRWQRQQQRSAGRTGQCGIALCLLRAVARRVESAAARDWQSGDRQLRIDRRPVRRGSLPPAGVMLKR